jgi:hypothetical protein
MIHATFGKITLALFSGLLLLAVVLVPVPDDSDIYRVGYAVFIVVDVIFMPLAIIACWYLWHLWNESEESRQSWLLLRDAIIGTGLTVVSNYIGTAAILRLAGFGPFENTAPFTALAVVIVSGITVYMAAIYWLRRAGDTLTRRRRMPRIGETANEADDRAFGDQRREQEHRDADLEAGVIREQDQGHEGGHQ